MPADVYKKLPRNTYTYKVFLSIRGRCLNPHHKLFPKYGGAGIKLCPILAHDFHGYKHFVDAVGMAPSVNYIIVRENKDIGFVPGNISWKERNASDT